MTVFKLVALAGALCAVQAQDQILEQRRGESEKSYYVDNRGLMHLKLDRNNGFKIMQVTDLHFAEDLERDNKTIDMINEIIRKESPDFMAVTGDLISGQMYDFSEEESGFWGQYFESFFGHMNSFDIPWGFVPGYADYETNWGNKKMMEEISKQHLHSDVNNKFKFLGQQIEHGFNFRVPIEANDSDNTQVGQLWFLGTGKSDCIGQIGRDCIRRTQIEWFKSASQNHVPNDKFKQNGIAFMHTPLQEHMYMVNSTPVHGQRRDYSECQALNTGFFAEALQQKTIKWITCGSDHSSDYWGIYGGLGLSYGRKSGFGSYGPKFQKHGARIFDLSFDLETGEMDVQTWIREEDGLVDNQEEWVPPQTFSWLKSPYCHGSEKMTEEQKKRFYAPGSVFTPES